MNHPSHTRALDVAAPTASYLAERLRGDLLRLPGPELHHELTLIILTALLAFTESGAVPQPPVPAC